VARFLSDIATENGMYGYGLEGMGNRSNCVNYPIHLISLWTDSVDDQRHCAIVTLC